MSQQINLLQSRSRTGAARPAALGAMAMLAVAVGVVLVYGYAAQRRTADLRGQADAGAARVATLRTAIQSARVAQAQGSSAMAVEEEIASLRPRAQAATELVAGIRGGQAGNAEGFGRLLALLGTQAGDGVWITGVEITKGAREMVVSGGADRHEAVVQYARRLNEAYAPYGVQFRSIELRPENPGPGAAGGPAAVLFKLS